MPADEETATFAGGCFWCIEAAFNQVDGVTAVTSGYTGGDVDDPSYEEVCSGDTGHVEAVRLRYDPDTVAYEELLDVFFTVHDPTSKYRQGPDEGPQYRPVIFYHTDEQREAAETYIDTLAEAYTAPIATAVEPAETFYPAEDEHQDYYENHPNAAYCVVNITPKLEKLQEQHPDLTTDK